MDKAKEFLEYIVKCIVDRPDMVAIEAQTDEMGVLLILNLAKEDMGKIIGRGGQTAAAIRSLLRVIGAKERATISLKIAEPS